MLNSSWIKTRSPSRPVVHLLPKICLRTQGHITENPLSAANFTFAAMVQEPQGGRKQAMNLRVISPGTGGIECGK